jgi:hypothetical protein
MGREGQAQSGSGCLELGLLVPRECNGGEFPLANQWQIHYLLYLFAKI